MVVHTRKTTPRNAQTSMMEKENNPINANAVPVLYKKKSERAGQKKKQPTLDQFYM
jgi:hypothetical protein